MRLFSISEWHECEAEIVPESLAKLQQRLQNTSLYFRSRIICDGHGFHFLRIPGPAVPGSYFNDPLRFITSGEFITERREEKIGILFTGTMGFHLFSFLVLACVFMAAIMTAKYEYAVCFLCLLLFDIAMAFINKIAGFSRHYLHSIVPGATRNRPSPQHIQNGPDEGTRSQPRK